MPAAPRQSGSVLQECHGPLPLGDATVYCRSCTAYCPQAVRQCIAGVPLPPAPRQWGCALQESHCPLPQGSEAVYCRRCPATAPRQTRSVRQGYHSPLPIIGAGNAAVRSGNSTADSPPAA